MNKRIKKIEEDIKSIKIQGATNVALAILKGIRVVTKEYSGDGKRFRKEIERVGKRLSEARENEPLARNAVKFILKDLEGKDNSGTQVLKDTILAACDQYEAMIANAKVEMIKFGTEILAKEEGILTHCHSSSAITVLKNVAKLRFIRDKEFRVITTETRPLYQGRKTAKELLDAGVDVTQIVDSACASFIISDRHLPLGAVVVGCDELLRDGSFINKVGTYSIALAAKQDKDEFYVATTLLKLDPKRSIKHVEIEQRDAKEVWKEAPKGLKIINPAFEQVKSEYVTGYITEAGVLKKKDLINVSKKIYPWLFERPK